MARIKIEDLPVLEDLSPKEVKGIFGGATSRTGGDVQFIIEEGITIHDTEFAGSAEAVKEGTGEFFSLDTTELESAVIEITVRVTGSN